MNRFERIDFENKPVKDLVSIVIVRYNEKELLEILISSIEKHDYPNYETICVFNRPDPATEQHLLKKNVRVITSPENLWLTGGANLGAAKARGEFLLVLNCDTELKEDAISKLIKGIKREENIDAIAPKVLRYDGSIDSVGQKFIAMGWDMNVGSGKRDVGQYDHPREITCFEAAALLVKRTAIEKCGLFDARFKYLKESLDLCCRMKKEGMRFFTCPEAVIYHRRGGSFNIYTNNPTILYFKFRNDLFTLIKHFHIFYLAAVLPIHIFYGLITLVYLLLMGKFKCAESVRKAMFDGFIFMLKNREKPLSLRQNLKMINALWPY
jgi:hypothetical protein